MQTFSSFLSEAAKKSKLEIIPLETRHIDKFVEFRTQSKKESSFLNPMSADRAKKVIADNPSGAFVLLEDGDIVGQLFVEPKDAALYIQLISVLQKSQGTGAGKQLLNYAEKLAKTKQLKKVTLTVASTNDHAIGFYEHQGYELDTKNKKQLNYVKEL